MTTPGDDAFPIIKAPGRTTDRPVVVAIPHFGEAALPGFEAEAYAEAEFVHFARGFADPFAAAIYGHLHAWGATVVASPYSRLFVDLNRDRDDFHCRDGVVESNKGVVRTHTRSGRPVFRDVLKAECTERRLRRFYDPYHRALREVLDQHARDGEPAVFIDAHTALSARFGDHEVIVSTQRGKTATPGLDRLLGECFATEGFAVAYDVSGYAGGYCVREYGRMRERPVDALQVEVGLGALIDTPRMAFIDAVKDGQRPEACPDRLGRLQAAMERAVRRLGGASTAPLAPP